MSLVPAPLQAFVDGIQPMRVVTTVAPVLGGVAAAEIGAAALKHISHVEDFANGSIYADAAVHMGGGLIIDGVITTGYFLATKDKAGAGKIGALMAVGSLVSATRPIVAPAIAKGVDVVSSAVAKMLGTSTAPAASTTQVGAGTAPSGLADFNPSGLADFNPGGADAYGGSAWGG